MGVSSIPFREILCQNEDAKMKVTIPTEDSVFAKMTAKMKSERLKMKRKGDFLNLNDLQSY